MAWYVVLSTVHVLKFTLEFRYNSNEQFFLEMLINGVTDYLFSESVSVLYLTFGKRSNGNLMQKCFYTDWNVNY